MAILRDNDESASEKEPLYYTTSSYPLQMRLVEMIEYLATPIMNDSLFLALAMADCEVAPVRARNNGQHECTERHFDGPSVPQKGTVNILYDDDFAAFQAYTEVAEI